MASAASGFLRAVTFAAATTGRLHRRWSSTASSELHFCIVGSGPAGFYTADRLLKRYGDRARVDILERLPTPFGLVATGVAPDHPDTKNVVNRFTRIAEDDRVAYFGNVCVGQCVSVSELRGIYHGVVLAFGAEGDRSLGVKGESLRGVFSAREFVWWYNGHPEYTGLPVDLSEVESVAVVGMGNVAVDCARLLLKRPEELAKTDIARHATRQLWESKVREVHMIGRRGPAQASFTPKELRELLNLPGVWNSVRDQDLILGPHDEEDVRSVRHKKRVQSILEQAAAGAKKRVPSSGDKSLHLHFFRSPVELLPDPVKWHVGSVTVEENNLKYCEAKGVQKAVGTGRYEDIPAQMVLKSIGYLSIPLDGVLFDEKKGIIPNKRGRVLVADGDDRVETGLYVCGWVKRGPTGVIGSNIMDAEDTVDSIWEDTGSLEGRKLGEAGRAQLVELLEGRGVLYVGWERWKRLDEIELERGKSMGKTRDKVTSRLEMLELAFS